MTSVPGTNNSTELPERLARVVADPRSYANWDALHEDLKTIRREHPFARAHIDGYNPFWVASRFDDIRAIALNNEVFKSGMGGILSNEEVAFERRAGIGGLFRSVVAMNEPDHRKYRMLTQAWFQPKNLQNVEARVRVLAKRYVDRLEATGSECEFVGEIAVHYPLLVIMSILGVPEEDEPMMLRLTQEYFGNKDADLNRDKQVLSPEENFQAVRRVIEDATTYFGRISEARRRHPTDDLASVIANAVIDGKPISDVDAMGYYITVAFAGHDTTTSSLAGAVWALCENSDQLELLKRNPALTVNLAEEAVRWTTPIHQFTRIASRDFDFNGQQVRKGDWVVLCFPSGNRDEAVFDEPFRFRVDREKSTHVGFGYGAHMCLGMHLARMELRAFFDEMLPRIRRLELNGTPTRTITNFVGGPKSVPVRFDM
jgi:cytochrome P450